MASLAASGGVAVATDVVKYLLAGADVMMTTPALLRQDAGYMARLNNDLRDWMAEREFSSPDDLRGMMSWRRRADQSTYTRTNHLRILGRGAAR